MKDQATGPTEPAGGVEHGTGRRVKSPAFAFDGENLDEAGQEMRRAWGIRDGAAVSGRWPRVNAVFGSRR